MHHVLHHHHARHHAHAPAFFILAGLSSFSCSCFSFNFCLKLDVIPGFFSFVDDLAVFYEGINQSLVLLFADHIAIYVYFQNILQLYEGLPVLPSNSLVNYSSFIMACVILVDFLLDGHSVRYSNPAAHLDAFGHQAPLAFADDSGGPSAATAWP